MKKLKRIPIFVATVLCCAVIACASYYEYYNVIPFQRGIGLTASQVKKIEMSSFGITYSTTDPTKISEFYNLMKDVKLKRDWNPQIRMGTGFVVVFYPKQGKGDRYHSGGSGNFQTDDGYSGPGLVGTTYYAVNYDELDQILENFYVSLGGKIAS